MTHDQIKTSVTGLLGHFGYGETDIDVTYDEKSHMLWFAITSPHVRALFNKNAEGLAALNHLATKIAETIMPDAKARPRVVVDANNHEKKKIDSLRTTAHMMAERARYFKSSISIDPMPPHERRIIHEFLSEMTDLETESEGTGDKRHIVIKYKGGI